MSNCTYQTVNQILDVNTRLRDALYFKNITTLSKQLSFESNNCLFKIYINHIYNQHCTNRIALVHNFICIVIPNAL